MQIRRSCLFDDCGLIGYKLHFLIWREVARKSTRGGTRNSRRGKQWLRQCKTQIRNKGWVTETVTGPRERGCFANPRHPLSVLPHSVFRNRAEANLYPRQGHRSPFHLCSLQHTFRGKLSIRTMSKSGVWFIMSEKIQMVRECVSDRASVSAASKRIFKCQWPPILSVHSAPAARLADLLSKFVAS